MRKVGRPKGSKSTDGPSVGTYKASKLSGMCPRTVCVWIDSGKLKSHRLPGVGSHRRVLRRDLALFLTDHGMPVPEELKHYVEER